MKRSPEAQALLERYRDALSPAPGARERGLAELVVQLERIERGEPPGSRRSGTRPRSARDVRPRSRWGARWRSAAIGGGLGVAVVLAWQLATRPAHHATPTLIARGPAPVVAPTPTSPAAAESESSPPTAAETNALERESAAPVNARTTMNTVKSHRASPNAAARRTAAALPAASDVTLRPDVRGVQSTAAKAVGAAEPRPAAPTLPSNLVQGGELERELRLLRAAYAALRAGHPDIALSRLTEHALRFPHGELAESRDVAQIMALCQAGQVALARQHAEQFLRQRPSSANAARVRSLCAAP